MERTVAAVCTVGTLPYSEPTLYPRAFLALLDNQGIDSNKEGEVFDTVGPFDDKIRPTGGWFYFVGELIKKGEGLMHAGDFQYWVQPSFPRAPACFGESVAAIEFATKVTWVLDEEPTG